MTEYGIVLGERMGDSFYTSPGKDATHIVEYGDGAVIHTTPVADYNHLKKTLNQRFPVVKEQIPKSDLENKAHVTIGSGLEIRTLSSQMDRMRQ